jgi:UrcA family protein
MKRFAMIMISALGLCGAHMAAAETNSGVQLSKTVGYGELDLTQPAAIEILHRRLHNAAEQVCSPLEGRKLWSLREHRECISAALSRAVTSIDRPLLTQYHLEKSGGAEPRVAAR